MKPNSTIKMMPFVTIRKRSKFIAAFFALNLLVEILAPMQAWALTGGPSQPESSSFEPVGTTDMVDLFTGDFTYNVPLFDVGGYPVNISYHAGVSMDQEASWVGLGWNINPGAINRGMRGVPDDFLGDEVKKEMNMKQNTSWALKFNTDLEIFGFMGQKKRNKGKEEGQANSDKQIRKMDALSKTRVGFGVVYNSYKGLGYSLDFSTDISKTILSEEDYAKKIEEQTKKYEENLNNANQNIKDEEVAVNANVKTAQDNFNNNTDPSKNAELSSALKTAKLQQHIFGLNKPNYQSAEEFTKSLKSDPKRLAKSPKKSITLSYGINSQDGASFSGSLSFGNLIKSKNNSNHSISPNIGLGYNSFMGMSSFDVNLGYSFKFIKSPSGYLPINTYSYVPNINMSTLSTSNSFNATIGLALYGGHPDMRLSGFYNTEEIENKEVTKNAYGYLYEQESFWSRGGETIMMDFNREKESAVNKNMSHLPLANHTYDVYSVSGQGTGGMYRPHRKTIGILHDAFARNKNKRFGMNDLGMERGFGSNFRFGLNYKNKVQKSSTGLWGNRENGSPADNELLQYLSYRMSENEGAENKRHKQVYFKAAGEQTPSDNSIGENWGGKQSVSLRIEKTKLSNRNLRFGKLKPTLNQKPGEFVTGSTSDNAIRSNVISYLTAEESSQNGIGVDPQIISYPQNYWTNYIKTGNMGSVEVSNRYGGANGAKAHHISEIISNSGDGMRYVYGLPAYNTTQEEVSFAISQDMNAKNTNVQSRSLRTESPEKGLVQYNPSHGDNSLNNVRGVDHHYNKTTMPAYAHSYLLTGVLSPDYADLTGNGISDDDYGSAVKFNYYKTPGQYKWRTPYERNLANLDEGLTTDNSDNKASYIYGQKEQWYVQSMESKTHIAEFKLSKRKDGHGVIDQDGGLSTDASNSSMKLDSIVVYSKYDIYINGKNAVPVKTIVFQYDYSLCPGVPNNENGGGKLTLKSIYFTYGNSGKGALNPYKFNYSNFNPAYSHVHYDRWGNYKYADEKLPNRYFPYDDYLTSRDTMDKYATAWNLSQIELPSGGKIDVKYEADDYAYVQDRKAMNMMKIVGSSEKKNTQFTTASATRNTGRKATVPEIAQLYNAGKDHNYLYFELKDVPSGGISDKLGYLLANYLMDENGKFIDYIYYRFKVNMDPRSAGSDNFEYVSGYANIDMFGSGITDDNKYGYIKLNAVNQGDAGLTKCNPIAKQAWQMGLQQLRKVIFPGSDLSQGGENGDRQSAMTGLKNAFTTSLNIFTGPYQNLRWKQIAQNFELNKSYIRLYNPKGKKVGGGCRVKRITINDNWNTMDNTQTSGQYGQEFDYITKTNMESNSGDVISSGVASYEPFVGGDENPFRRPAFYHTNRFLFPDLNEYHEEPFGESFFPSASVGYSRVVVRNIPKPGTIVTSTGKVVHEFFTAKNYPIQTTNTPLKFITNGGGNSADNGKKNSGKKWKKFTKSLKGMFNVVKRDYMTATQGYSIILNDMHGKPKSTAIYSSLDEDQDIIKRQFTGRLLSGSEYKYKTESTPQINDFGKVFDRADTAYLKPVPRGSRLSNHVWVMKENGQLAQREIATSYDIAVDARESKSHHRHAGVDFNLENFMILSIPCPYPKYLVTQNLYQGAVVTKVIQQYGVLDETIAYDHSSIVKTKNLVWDEQTGQVLLTSTTNEFDDPLYNYTYPAHLAYEGMGPAYKNIDYETELNVLGSGEADLTEEFGLTAESKDKFFPGDELLMRKGGKVIKGWVLKATKGNTNPSGYEELQVIDDMGFPIDKGYWTARVIRSGKRNLAATPVGAITTMSKNIFKNGENDNRLVLNENIVQSSAAIFNEEWQGYMNKSAYTKQKCDSFYLGIDQIHQLIKGIVVKDNTGDKYKYKNTTPTVYPPNLSSISTITPFINRTIELFANKKLTTKWGENKYSIYDYYLAAGAGGDSTNFYFKVKYKCNGDEAYKLEDLNCEMSLTPSGGCGSIPIHYADSISKILTRTNNTATFNAYRNGSSCTYTLTFPNTCYFEVVCKSIANCDYYVGKNINPYTNNLKGIWRQKEAFAFNSSRNYENKQYHNSNIRKDGMIENYQPFWTFKGITAANGLERNAAAGTEKWVSTGQATIYSPEGNGLEEKDAMNIYSSQLFGYDHKLVTAQAGNARYRQIAFDNFEDYLGVEVGCYQQEDHFNFKKGLYFKTKGAIVNSTNDLIIQWSNMPLAQNPNVWLVKDTAHSGVYSLCVKNGKTHSAVRKLDYSDLSFAEGNDSFFRIKTLDKVITPFAPTPGKYVVSAWVQEKYADQNAVNTYNDAYLNIKVYDGGTAVVNQDVKASGMIIENWQRIDGVFTIPVGADSIKVSLVNNGTVRAFFDDVRLHPFDAKMAGHVYHAIHLKVLAELDDNNYATFYEYDDEGSLVRVKRETEKGIVTIQESRKSIKKKTP